ncbi:hypothetical protein Bca4012_007981 [Brassica carinata]
MKSEAIQPPPLDLPERIFSLPVKKLWGFACGIRKILKFSADASPVKLSAATSPMKLTVSASPVTFFCPRVFSEALRRASLVKLSTIASLVNLFVAAPPVKLSAAAPLMKPSAAASPVKVICRCIST